MAAEKQIRIFIADGSRDCALLLQSLLEREEDIAVVGVATRGDDALARFADSGADLLLCDLLLPGLDGLGLLRRLKEAGVLRHAIVLSGFFNDAVARAASFLADYYLPKPVSGEELLRNVRACVLGTARSFSRNERAEVRRALLDVCVMPHLDGFRYLQSALERTLEDPALLRGVTKALYRDIAKEFATTPACVERSMRAAIERAWARMDAPQRTRLFGPQAAQWDKAPSNVPFLTAMTAFLDGRDAFLGEKQGKRASFD